MKKIAFYSMIAFIFWSCGKEKFPPKDKLKQPEVSFIGDFYAIIDSEIIGVSNPGSFIGYGLAVSRDAQIKSESELFMQEIKQPPAIGEKLNLELTNLLSETRYHVRAFMRRRADSTLFLGPVIDFTTLPTSNTNFAIRGVKNISSRAAVAVASSKNTITSDSYGFIIGKEPDVRRNQDKVVSKTGRMPTNFELSFSGLFPNTEYYIRAFSRRGNSINYSSNEIKFKTTDN